MLDGLGDVAKAAVQGCETTSLINREASDASLGSTIENTSYGELVFLFLTCPMLCQHTSVDFLGVGYRDWEIAQRTSRLTNKREMLRVGRVDFE